MRYRPSGSFALERSARNAIGLFTPEGEREWVPEWDPFYPDGNASEGPGTIFTTHAHGAQTIWVILEIDRARWRSAYARVTPGHHAGTVRVHCIDADPGRCRVHVEYDMSLLPGADSVGMHGYGSDAFESMLIEWKTLIEYATQDT
jgi:hypothetical protein